MPVWTAMPLPLSVNPPPPPLPPCASHVPAIQAVRAPVDEFMTTSPLLPQEPVGSEVTARKGFDNVALVESTVPRRSGFVMIRFCARAQAVHRTAERNVRCRIL